MSPACAVHGICHYVLLQFRTEPEAPSIGRHEYLAPEQSSSMAMKLLLKAASIWRFSYQATTRKYSLVAFNDTPFHKRVHLIFTCKAGMALPSCPSGCSTAALADYGYDALQISVFQCSPGRETKTPVEKVFTHRSAANPESAKNGLQMHGFPHRP